MAILIIEHSNLTGSHRLGERLLDDGHRLITVRVHLGEELPTDLDEIDGVISGGGPQSPLSKDEPWIEQELSLLREANKRQIPILGICLGCQLLARALGGEVGKLEAPEFGMCEVTLTPQGRECVLFAGQPWYGTMLQWHEFGITTLPEDSTLLATSSHCNVQAWSNGINSFGIQYHPECDRATISAWIKDDSRMLHERNISKDNLEQEVDECYPEYERLTNRFFDAVSQILMPVHNRLHRQRS